MNVIKRQHHEYNNSTFQNLLLSV